MTRKCETCGADMVELFSSSVCSKDCKGDTPLETPDEKLKFCEEPGYQKAMKEAGGSWKSSHKCGKGDKQPMSSDDVDDNTKNDIIAGGAIQGDKYRDPYSSRKYNRSGSYPAPTEEEIQQQKKKMLKALTNFNTIADEYMYLDKMVCYACKLKRLEFIATGVPNYVKVECKNCGITGMAKSTCQKAYEVWKQAWKPWREPCEHSITNLKEFSALVAEDFDDPLLLNNSPSIKKNEEEMIKALGIPSHIIDGVKNNDEKVRGQCVTQMVMDEYCNLDASIFDNIISSLRDSENDPSEE